MTPEEQLTRALVDLASRGQRPRCGDPGDHALWTSDQHSEREQAAQRCTGCRVIEPCRAVGENEPAHVWGGVDRSGAVQNKRPYKRKAAA